MNIMLHTFPDSPPTARRGGGARIEILVVVACLLTISLIVVPYILDRREIQRRVHCQQRLQQWHVAIVRHSELRGNVIPWRSAGEISWIADLRPLLTEDDTDSDPAILRCPNGRDYPPDSHSYVGNGGWGEFRLDADGVLEETSPSPILDWNSDGQRDPDEMRRTRATGLFWPAESGIEQLTADEIDAADGLSYTLLLTESQTVGSAKSTRLADLVVVIGRDRIKFAEDAGATLDPQDVDLGPYRINARSEAKNHANPNSTHPGGVNVLFADGSIRFLSDQIDDRAYLRFGTPFGTRYGERPDLPR